MLSLKTHNIIDYVVAFFLVLSPYLFGFAEVERARNLFLFGGFALAGYSLITKYFYSIAKIIPLGVHMSFDVILGVLFVFSPYIFAYRAFITGGQMVLHLIVGLGAISLVVFTRTRSEKDKTIEERRLTSGETAQPKVQHRKRV
jgi:hypothetical protein